MAAELVETTEYNSSSDLDRLRHLRELAFSKRKELLDDKLSYYTPARDQFVAEVLQDDIHDMVEKASADGKLRMALRIWSNKEDDSANTYGTERKLTLSELSRVSRHLPHDERLTYKIQEQVSPYKVYISEFRNTPDGYEKEDGVSYFGLFVDWNNKRRFNARPPRFNQNRQNASPQGFRRMNPNTRGGFRTGFQNRRGGYQGGNRRFNGRSEDF